MPLATLFSPVTCFDGQRDSVEVTAPDCQSARGVWFRCAGGGPQLFCPAGPCRHVRPVRASGLRRPLCSLSHTPTAGARRADSSFSHRRQLMGGTWTAGCDRCSLCGIPSPQRHAGPIPSCDRTPEPRGVGAESARTHRLLLCTSLALHEREIDPVIRCASTGVGIDKVSQDRIGLRRITMESEVMSSPRDHFDLERIGGWPERRLKHGCLVV